MNPLDQLKDIHLPEAVSFWPLAWTWWVILFAIIGLIALALWYRKQQAWRRYALKQLKAIDWQQEHNACRDCNKILKQIALQKLGKESAPLSGENWLEYLDKQVKHPIFMPHLRPFAHILDEPNIHVDTHQLHKATAQWIRKVKC